MLLEETQSKSFRITVPWKKAEGDIRNFICKRFSSTVCNDIKAFYTHLKVQYVLTQNLAPGPVRKKF